MLKRCRGIIFAVTLGLVFPALLIAMLEKNKPETQIFVPESTQESKESQTASYEISVLMNDGSIQSMRMVDYLTRVVLREMPADFDVEALKAQAVVARTYALRRTESGGKHIGAAVCVNSECCQGYCEVEEYLDKGGSRENVEKIQGAVAITENLVLTYNGKLIDATYFSCSGGMTEDAKAVWGQEVPYLQSTTSPGEENATHYIDTVSFSKEEFAELLGVDTKDSNSNWVSDITYTPGGGVATIKVCGNLFKGTDFRKKLNLRSTAFVISIVGDTVTITTKGFGHRVGMSQYGAEAMAVKGSGFPDILAHYYTGTQLLNYNAD